MKNTDKVFVYGTLKRGHANCRLMSEAKFLGVAKTTESVFVMLDGCCPAVVRAEGEPGIQIQGEVYEINALTFARLDRLEDHPHTYRRELIEIEGHGLCWVYLLGYSFAGMIGERVPNGRWEGW